MLFINENLMVSDKKQELSLFNKTKITTDSKNQDTAVPHQQHIGFFSQQSK
jgi:hypothetical protein